MLRESTYGWLVRMVHSNGASAVFWCIYGHVLRSWCYGVTAYVLPTVWLVGTVVLRRNHVLLHAPTSTTGMLPLCCTG